MTGQTVTQSKICACSLKTAY